MDRGLLSDPRVLEASRAFVCARLITYQDAGEGEFLKTLGASRTGGVLNTAFALLAPDGKTIRSGTGRSPRQAWRGSEDETVTGLIAAMRELAAEFPSKKVLAAPAIPYLASTKIALNVASCDNQPMVLVVAKSESKRAAFERQLQPLAWDPAFRGRFAFSHAADPKELGMIEGAPTSDGVFVVQPGTYGLEGYVLAKTSKHSDKAIRVTLQEGMDSYRPMKKGRRETKAAQRRGLTWDEDTTVRESDPSNSRRARRRRGR